MEKKLSAIQALQKQLSKTEADLLNELHHEIDQRTKADIDEAIVRRRSYENMNESVKEVRAAQRRLEKVLVGLVIAGIIQAGMILVLTLSR